MDSVKRRLSFWQDALTRGGTRAFYLVAALGVVVGLTALALLVEWAGWSWLVAVPVAVAVLLAIFAEGSYRVWDETDRKLCETHAEVEKRAKKDIVLENLGRRLMLGAFSPTVGLSFLKEEDPAYYEAELEKARKGAKQWAQGTYAYVQDAVGWDEAALFRSDFGLPSQYDGPSSYLADEREIEKFLARRSLRLQEIMVRVRASE